MWLGSKTTIPHYVRSLNEVAQKIEKAIKSENGFETDETGQKTDGNEKGAQYYCMEINGAWHQSTDEKALLEYAAKNQK